MEKSQSLRCCFCHKAVGKGNCFRCPHCESYFHFKCALDKPLETNDFHDRFDKYDGFDERLNKLTRDKEKHNRKW